MYEKTFEDTIVDVIFDTVTLEEAKAMGWKEEAFSEEEKAKGKDSLSAIYLSVETLMWSPHFLYSFIVFSHDLLTCIWSISFFLNPY